MAVVWLWVRADLRRRWRAWVVLGVLAGAVVGLAAAGAAGARRTSRALPALEAKAPQLDVAVAPNSVEFDEEKRAEVAALPEVEHAASFAILGVTAIGDDNFSALVPVDAPSARLMRDVLVEGRHPRNDAAGEAIVDENARKRLGLEIGKTFPVEGEVEGGPPVRRRLRVVGIMKSVDDETNWQSSPAFARDVIDAGVFSFTNMFVQLRNGSADSPVLEHHLRSIMGRPVNTFDLNAQRRQARDSTNLEARGLWLFVVAVLLGGGTLVGQALARTVSSGATDLATWEAMGAGRRTLTTALVLPSVVTGAVAALVTFGVAVALSPRFPIGVARHYDLDLGVHIDWVALASGAVVAFGSVVAGAALVAAWRVARGEARAVRPSAVGRWATLSGLPPAPAIGTRLALEPGRGRRAVPVRSAIIGAIAGAMGVVACFTFRAGIDDATSRPERTGIVWNAAVGDINPLPEAPLAALVRQPQVTAATRARWIRSVVIDGQSVPTWAAEPVKGNMEWVLLQGRAPRGPDEIAFGSDTLGSLGLQLGDTVRAGPDRVPLRVVGEALLPWSPHTAYTEGGWIEQAALPRVQPDPARQVDGFDFLLLRLAPGTNREAVAAPLRGTDLMIDPPVPASDVQALGEMRTLPLVLGVFLALLAVATLAHALVTTVSRRRHELAVLRALGFGRRQSRLAIAWQATLLAVIGLLIGVPLGLIAGRVVWRSLADSFPFVYAPPLALLATVLVVPIAILVANLLAAAPGRRAARIQPAAVLRSE